MVEELGCTVCDAGILSMTEQQSGVGKAGRVVYVILSVTAGLVAVPGAGVNSWRTVAAMGPAWHFAVFLMAYRRPFQLLGGKFRVEGEDVAVAFLGLFIWSLGWLAVHNLDRSEDPHSHRWAWGLLIVAWGAIGLLNVFLDGFFAV